MSDPARITAHRSSGAVLRTRFNEWLASMLRRWAARPPEPLTEQAWDRLERSAAASAAILARESREAPFLLAELVAQPGDDRIATVARDARFLSVPLAQLLLEERHRDPADESLARCALVIAESIRPTVAGSGPLENLKTAAWTEVGRARHAAGDLAGAEHAFLCAASHLSAAPEPLEEAKLLRARALLLRDRGKIALAAGLQHRAVHLLASFALAPMTSVALAELAALSLEAGRPQDRDLALEHAAFLMRDDPDAVAPAVGSLEDLASRLAAGGQHEQAGALIDAAIRILAPALPPAEHAELTWTAGRVRLASSDPETAERLLETGWQGLLRARRPELAAAAFLDLLTLLVRRRKHAVTVRALTGGMSRLSVAHLHPSSRAALNLAAHAVLSGGPCTGLLDELATFVRTGPRTTPRGR